MSNWTKWLTEEHEKTVYRLGSTWDGQEDWLEELFRTVAALRALVEEKDKAIQTVLSSAIYVVGDTEALEQALVLTEDGMLKRLEEK